MFLGKGTPRSHCPSLPSQSPKRSSANGSAPPDSTRRVRSGAHPPPRAGHQLEGGVVGEQGSARPIAWVWGGGACAQPQLSLLRYELSSWVPLLPSAPLPSWGVVGWGGGVLHHLLPKPPPKPTPTPQIPTPTTSSSLLPPQQHRGPAGAGRGAAGGQRLRSAPPEELPALSVPR